MIRNEDGLLTGYVFIDVAGRPVLDFVDQAQRELQNKLNYQPATRSRGADNMNPRSAFGID